jgi:hypothetical protein
MISSSSPHHDDDHHHHQVSMEELEQCRQEPFPLLCGRLGIANLFNPLRPEREYALNLRNHDEATVAQLLVILTAEPGALVANIHIDIDIARKKKQSLAARFQKGETTPHFWDKPY